MTDLRWPSIYNWNSPTRYLVSASLLDNSCDVYVSFTLTISQGPYFASTEPDKHIKFRFLECILALTDMTNILTRNCIISDSFEP